MVDWTRLRRYMHKNDFFTVTGLNGWAFIYKSQTIGEVCLWWTLILVFIGLTLYNVEQLVVYFASQNMEHTISLRSSATNIGIPNMTFTFTVPLLEFSSIVPLDFSKRKKCPSFQKPFPNGRSLLRDYICNLGVFEYYAYEVYGELAKGLKQQLLSLPMEQVVQIRKDRPGLLLSDPDVLQEWLLKLNQSMLRLTDLFDGVIRTPQEYLEPCEIRSNISYLIQEPLSHRSMDTVSKLLLLEGLSSRRDPRAVFGQPAFPSSARDILERAGATAQQLYNDVLFDLSHVLHVGIEPNGVALLHSWNIDIEIPNSIDNQKIITHVMSGANGGFFTGKQSFTVSVLVPPGLRSVTVKYFSYLDMWIRHMLAAWANLFMNDDIPCPIPWKRYTGSDNLPYFHEEWLIYLKEHSSHVGIQMPNGEVFTVPPRYMINKDVDYSISFAPSINLISNIETCASGTLADCINVCAAQQLLRVCHCVPWHRLHWVKNESAICNGPCDDTMVIQQCKQECQKSFEHPCHMALLHVGHMLHNETLSLEAFGAGSIPYSNIALQSKRIHIYLPEAFSFIEAIAEYEMSTNTFFSMLGGSIEFWGMFTVPALLHCFVYLITHSCKRDVQPESQSPVMDLDAVGQELEDSVSELRKSLTKVHWWYWLKDSSFYRETPMIGYGFISAAATYVEAVFWYMIITIFAILTVVNLKNIIDRFASSSTSLIVTPTIKSEPFHLPNLTIELHLPICELTSRAFELKPLYNADIVQSDYELYDIYTSLLRRGVPLKGEHFPQRLAVITEHLNQLLVTKSWNELISNRSEDNEYERSLTNPSIVKHWDKILTVVSDKLLDLSKNKKSYSENELHKMVPKLLHLPFEYADRDELLFKLMLLHGLKHGSMTFSNLAIEKNASSIMEELHLQPRNLLASTVNSLAKLIQFDASASGIKVLFTDFNIHWGSTFQLNFNIIIPLGLQRLEISILTLMSKWRNEFINHTTTAITSKEGVAFNDQFSLLVLLNGNRIADIDGIWYNPNSFFVVFKPPGLSQQYTLQAV